MAQVSDELTDTQGTVDIDRDRALVLRCQEGDASAFAELYTRYYDRLLRFCRRRLGDSAEAEDMAQEAFVKAWRALPRFAGERRFYPWLTVIAGNLCTDVLRKRSRTVIDADGDLEARRAGLADDEITPEERVVAAADGELAQKALQRLTVRHRRVLALREGRELTYQQIAAREHVDVSTVETLLWRARQALKREFTALSGTGSASAVFGLGVVAALRRTFARIGHGAAMGGRRLAGFRFGGVPIREAAVALAVTAAAVTTGAQFLHGPPGAASATPVQQRSSAPVDLVGGRAVGAGARGPGAAVATPGSAAAPSAATALANGADAPSADPSTAGTSDATSSPTSPAARVPAVASPSAPSLPSLPAPGLPSSGLPSSVPAGVSGVVGIVTSTLPVTSVADAATGAASTVTSGAGAVSQALSATGAAVGSAVSSVPAPPSATSAPAVPSPLGGLLASTGGG